MNPFYGTKRYPESRSARRRIVRSQMRAKKRRMRARKELLDLRSASHRRAPYEYVRPTRTMRLYSWESASRISSHDSRPFEERPLTWMGVRGARYSNPSGRNIHSGRWLKVWGELVPEPLNPADGHALAIDVDGARLGYAPANYAYYAHPYISALNGLGFRVVVPLQYRCDYDPAVLTRIASGFAALPTFQTLAELFPENEAYFSILAPLWDALGEDTRAQISADRFHLTVGTLSAMLKLRHLAPEARLPDKPRPGAVPPGVNFFLRQKRYEADEAAAQAREVRNRRIVAEFKAGERQVDIARKLATSSGVVSKVLNGAGIDTEAVREVRKQETEASVFRMIDEGHTRGEIATAVGLSSSTVSKLAASAGIATRSGGRQTDRARESMRERLEICRRVVERRTSGLARSQTAAELNLSESAVKTYLGDGQFFDGPSTNSRRLDIARAVRDSGMTRAQAAGGTERRALKDASMLDLIGNPWR